MKKNIFKKVFILVCFVLLSFNFVSKIEAFIPLSLESYEVSNIEISPDNDGVQDVTNIDIKYSEEVKSNINILNSDGDLIRSIYSSNKVTNPQSKVWDGKDDSDQVVPNGLYTIEILGTATADETNTLSDTSKTVLVNIPTPDPVTLTSISITSPATKLDYTVGETLDISGLEVTGTYSDDSTQVELLTLDSITGFDSSTPVVDQVLTITIDGQSTTYTVNINSTQPDTNNYSPLSVDTSVDVPSTCEVLDTDNVSHTYTASSADSYLGICALKAAIDSGNISSTKLSNQYPSMGLFVTSFNDVEADPSNQYWAFYENDSYAESGLSTLPVTSGDILSFKLSDFSGSETGDSVIIRIVSLIPTDTTNSDQNSGSSGGSSGSGSVPVKSFSVPQALAFLSLQQKPDSSFGDSLYTDWVAVAVKAGGDTSLESSIKDYLINSQISSSVVTDYERRAMALMALGVNPYTGTSVDYIKKITDVYDGTQIGDSSLFNDDIFGLIVLQNAGYSKSDEIIKNTIAYIISKQDAEGSWGSVDMTSAGIEALYKFKSVSGVDDSVSKAEDYLIQSQKSDGGFENSSSTSWAIQALSLNSSLSDNANKAIKYLTDKQQSDGGLDGSDLNNRVWVTAYAIPAALNLPWSEILESFDKNEEIKDSQASSSSEVVITPQKIIKQVFCPKGDLFSTKTGERCTAVEENIIPVDNSNINKKEDLKKNIVIKKATEEKITQKSPVQITENSPVNNLGASAGNAKLPISKISKTIAHSIVDVLAYIGKGVYGIISIFTK